MSVHDVLAQAQAHIAVPKGRNNDFGGFRYRKVEDIISAFRRCEIQGATLVLTDRLEEIGGQIFVIATARFSFNGESICAEGGAMHALQKKGMDASQITGSASSYARKYALQGLFALDDGENDPDSRDNRNEEGNPPFDPAAAGKRIMAAIAQASNPDDLTDLWRREAATIKQIGGAGEKKLIDTFGARKEALQQKDAAA